MMKSDRRGSRPNRRERRQQLREQFRERLVKALSEEPKQPGRARLQKARLNRFQRAIEFRKEWLDARRAQLQECEKFFESIKEGDVEAKPKASAKRGPKAKSGPTTKQK